MILALVTARWTFSISDSSLASTPLRFSQWILTRTVFSERITSISGKGSSDEHPFENSFEDEPSSSAESLDFLTRTVDSTVLVAFWSSRVLTLSSSSLICLTASPRIEALSF